MSKPESFTPPNDEELPGMLAVAKGVAEQRWPHTMDAKIWADEFVKLNPGADHGLMLGWFANAIMAGYDTAQARAVRSETAARPTRCSVSFEHMAHDYCDGNPGAKWGELSDDKPERLSDAACLRIMAASVADVGMSDTADQLRAIAERMERAAPSAVAPSRENIRAAFKKAIENAHDAIGVTVHSDGTNVPWSRKEVYMKAEDAAELYAFLFESAPQSASAARTPLADELSNYVPNLNGTVRLPSELFERIKLALK